MAPYNIWSITSKRPSAEGRDRCRNKREGGSVVAGVEEEGNLSLYFDWNQ